MKPINFSEKNYERISKEIKLAEGKAKERLISFEDMKEALNKIEEKLNIPKAHMTGVFALINCNHKTFPKAYKYKPQATIFIALYDKTCWKIADIYKGFCDDTFADINLTSEAKEAILNKYTKM